MKLRRKLNKGFTLVELIVVIAIIAILAAVSAVSYIAFINQANESADQQAVTQMNTALQASEAKGKPTSIQEVYDNLSENGMEGKDYKPLFSNRFFFWDSTINRIVYTDKNYNVSYPEKYKDQDNKNFFSLSGEVAEESYTTEGTIANVSNEKQLFKAMNEIKTNSVTEIKLSGEINMRGAEFTLSDSHGAISTTKAITIGGPDGTTAKISNFVNSKKHYYSDSANKSYGGGIVPNTINGNTVTIQNLVIDNASVGGYTFGSVGILFDQISGGKCVAKNVTIKNSSIYGQNKVGILIGSYHGTKTDSSISFTSISLENNTVYTSEGEAGVDIGFVRTKEKSFTNSVDLTNTLLSGVTYSGTNTVKFVLTGAHKKVLANTVEYTTKCSDKVDLKTTTKDGETVVRLCLVTKTNTKYTFGDMFEDANHPEKSNLINGATYDGKKCILDWNAKEVLLS